MQRDGSAASEPELKMLGASLQLTCLRVCDNLRDILGDDGCSALLVRAIARVEERHPVVTHVHRLEGGTVMLDRVAASVETYGADAVGAAVEALFAALRDVLGRLIGDDMAVRLMNIDGSARDADQDGTTP